MIIKRLTYLAVCLLVLLNVVSSMRGNNGDYQYYNSDDNSSLCLSFKNNRLTDCCKQDEMQQIYVHKTTPRTGIFHIKDYKRVLCYDMRKMKFKSYKRRNLGLRGCRHQRRRERKYRQEGKSYPGCTLTKEDIDKLKRNGCELHEYFGAGYVYISVERNARYLGLRRGRVQKHKKLRGNRVREPKVKDRRFLLMSESSLDGINSKLNMCHA